MVIITQGSGTCVQNSLGTPGLFQSISVPLAPVAQFLWKRKEKEEKRKKRRRMGIVKEKRRKDRDWEKVKG